MRLRALRGQSQAQLDGFKSRELCAEAPTRRHLYATEWRHIEVAGGAGAEVLAISDGEAVERERGALRVPELGTALRDGARAAVAVAVATQRGHLAASALSALEVALALVQMQAGAASNVWLLTQGTPEHAGS